LTINSILELIAFKVRLKGQQLAEYFLSIVRWSLEFAEVTTFGTELITTTLINSLTVFPFSWVKELDINNVCSDILISIGKTTMVVLMH